MDPTSREDLLHLQLWEIEEKEADRQGLKSYPCSCKKCMGARIVSRTTIRKHLRKYKRDPEFKTSILVFYPPNEYAILVMKHVGANTFALLCCADTCRKHRGILF